MAECVRLAGNIGEGSEQIDGHETSESENTYNVITLYVHKYYFFYEILKILKYLHSSDKK